MSRWVSEVAAAAALDRALSMRLTLGMGSTMVDKAKRQGNAKPGRGLFHGERLHHTIQNPPE